MSSQRIYFYPHRSFRDRQLDTILHWPREQVLNPELAAGKVGSQVSKAASNAPTIALGLRQRLPLPNIKLRPRGLAPDAIVYLWGGVVASGRFILELDNPFALTGFNLRAMSLYKGLFRWILSQHRCLQIRCMSEACRRTLGSILGPGLAARAQVVYPFAQRQVGELPQSPRGPIRFLFVGSQFEIKGGPALLRAFRRVTQAFPDARLDMVTHLPPSYEALARECKGLTIHEPRLTREELAARFMKHVDVLIHPTYVESFGLVVLEALCHGLAIIATDVYAIAEMVEDGKNGSLLRPPVSVWEGYLPSPAYLGLEHLKRRLEAQDTRLFEDKLAESMMEMAQNPGKLAAYRRGSLSLLERRFLENKLGYQA